MRRTPSHRLRAFTVLELLVVIAIVAVIAGLLLASLRGATDRSRAVKTRSIMRAVSISLDAFKSDHGYHPVVLNGSSSGRDGPAWRDVVPAPVPIVGNNPFPLSDYAVDMQRWYSMTTIPEFLLGAGGRDADGYGTTDIDTNSLGERPALGIRSPGLDGAWGSTIFGTGLFEDRAFGLYEDPSANPSQMRLRDPGRVYGPYLGIEGDIRLGKILPANTWPAAPTSEAQAEELGQDPVRVIDENSQDWLNPDAALVLLDPFDRPIEYFCNPYAPGDPSSVDQRKSTGVNGATPPIPQMRPSLADIIRLRPSAFGSESEFDGNISADVFNSHVQDLRGDFSASIAARTASYAIFSSGADATYNPWLRAHPLNADNIVEFGR
jgi:prepilin-type N-terminal cleavage/methylation domain-containing protein